MKQMSIFKYCSCLKSAANEDNIKISVKAERPTAPKKARPPVKKHNSTPRPAYMTKELFECNGRRFNQPGTVEHGIAIDGSTKEYESKLDRIIEWSSTRPKFNISSFYGILNNAEFRKQFSSRQREAIDNVYYKCDIYKHF
jgi:hypothetical protein